MTDAAGKRRWQAVYVAKNAGVDPGFSEGDGFKIAVGGVFDHHGNGLHRVGVRIRPGVGERDENVATRCVRTDGSAGAIGEIQRACVRARYEDRFGGDGGEGDQDGVSDEAGRVDALSVFEGAGAASKNNRDRVTGRIERKRRTRHIVGNWVAVERRAVGDIGQIGRRLVKHNCVAQRQQPFVIERKGVFDDVVDAEAGRRGVGHNNRGFC